EAHVLTKELSVTTPGVCPGPRIPDGSVMTRLSLWAPGRCPADNRFTGTSPFVWRVTGVKVYFSAPGATGPVLGRCLACKHRSRVIPSRPLRGFCLTNHNLSLSKETFMNAISQATVMKLTDVRTIQCRCRSGGESIRLTRPTATGLSRNRVCPFCG